MGLPLGWITGPMHVLTPNQQIAVLGNGVLPLQGAFESKPHSVDSRVRLHL